MATIKGTYKGNLRNEMTHVQSGNTIKGETRNVKFENLFINEFLPDAPGDCVKVFLFGLMYAQ